ncbi:MAG TPA: hypothetical protein PLS53_08995 [Thermoanaerobaculaceae bacterium]|nr:hypothetical protein [Thermoanaerobaculaceae bacterium]HPS78279.1 hypothetical protein [Thermoanaerobaculaceae bacterium]
MWKKWLPWMIAVLLGVGAGVGEAARLLVMPGRAVFSAGLAGRAVVLQAEAATRVEAMVGERTRVFVTDKDGVWELSAVGATRWDEKNWEAGTLWLATLLRGIDPKAGGVRTAGGVLAGMDERKVGKVTLPSLETQRDPRGVTALTVGGVNVTRTAVGPLPALAAEAFVVTGKKEKGLATLARLTEGLTGGQKGSAGSTAAARGVTAEEKKLGTTYDFASVEKVEAMSVSEKEVDDFIRSGNLGGGQ